MKIKLKIEEFGIQFLDIEIIVFIRLTSITKKKLSKDEVLIKKVIN